MSIRKLAAPRSLIVNRSEDLAAFAGRLGRVMYGPDWKGPFSKSAAPDETNVGTNEETMFLVREQIIEAICSGKIQLLVRVAAGSLQRKADPRPVTRVPREMDEDVFDAGYPWGILEPVWRSDFPINWSESSVEVPGDHLVGWEGDGVFSDYFDTISTKVKCYVKIKDPDSVLRRLVSFYDLPKDEWFARYNQNSSINSREMIASAWRFIAISMLGGVDITRKSTIDAMQNYKKWAGLKVSDDMIENLATKVVSRLENKDLVGPVFFHSTREPPKKPRAATGARAKPSM